MASCEQRGYTLECHAGCGVFCRNDCTDCIPWCEPSRRNGYAKCKAGRLRENAGVD